MYSINEIDGIEEAGTIRDFNSLMPEWPPIEDHHLRDGYWWLIHCDFGFGRPVGFAGMVEFTPFCRVGYFKRCYIHPEHRGGLQLQTMIVRETKARKIGWKQIVSETTSIQSADNMLKAGFSPCHPEQKWGEPGSRYFTKDL